jgi:hypothetical protein
VHISSPTTAGAVGGEITTLESQKNIHRRKLEREVEGRISSTHVGEQARLKR